jgi:hypothetical protein
MILLLGLHVQCCRENAILSFGNPTGWQEGFGRTNDGADQQEERGNLHGGFFETKDCKILLLRFDKNCEQFEE